MNFLINGLISLPWWGYILVVFALGQITFAAVTLYLHRSQAHLALELHPALKHFFRFWLWLTTSMSTKGWVSVHRKHHAKCETEEDPHSPRCYGIRKVLLQGAELYRVEDRNPETLKKYGHGTPDDWLERNLYASRINITGIALMLIINVLLFGVIGISIWALQMIWIPFHAAGVINGIGHYWGYRNYETNDDATNITPIAFWIAGEELHNNHHAYPSSAKFSIKSWEFDIGWMYICILRTLGLAKVKKLAPVPMIDHRKENMDLETVKAIVRSKMHVMENYANSVIKPVLRQEREQLEAGSSRTLKKAKPLLIRENSRMSADDKTLLSDALQNNKTLTKVYEFRLQLQSIWSSTYASQEKLLHAMLEWCHQAEASGIKALEEFASSLRSYALHPAV